MSLEDPQASRFTARGGEHSRDKRKISAKFPDSPATAATYHGISPPAAESETHAGATNYYLVISCLSLDGTVVDRKLLLRL